MNQARSASWKWMICGVLLLASAINYMDRQTLANAAVRITKQFSLSQEQYGNFELAFGWAFAAGSLMFGFAADKFSLRYLYPIVLTLWSLAGFFTGFARTYEEFLICRTFLGLFEAGHWPCAVKATQLLLEPKDRSMGNSVLQAGTSIGAIATPFIMRMLLTEELSSWRYAFQVVGLAGLAWVGLWFRFIRKGDLEAPKKLDAASGKEIPKSPIPWRVLLGKQMLIMIVVLCLINGSWQLIRAWLSKFLVEGRGYPETEMLNFNMAFYVATDIGCIAGGALTLFLNKRFSVDGSRKITFFLFAMLSALTMTVAWLPRGPLLLLVLLLVGAGALAVFPLYHAFTQDISREHQGKVTGFAAVAAWGIMSPTQKLYGRLIDVTGSFDLGLALAGAFPLLACIVLWLFWKPKSEPIPG